jgi:hypothetical protein
MYCNKCLDELKIVNYCGHCYDELEKTNTYFAGVIKQAAEEYLSANGSIPKWWTIPLMHEIKEILGITTPPPPAPTAMPCTRPDFAECHARSSAGCMNGIQCTAFDVLARICN